MVEQKLPKLTTGVRFPSPAPAATLFYARQKSAVCGGSAGGAPCAVRRRGFAASEPRSLCWRSALPGYARGAIPLTRSNCRSDLAVLNRAQRQFGRRRYRRRPTTRLCRVGTPESSVGAPPCRATRVVRFPSPAPAATLILARLKSAFSGGSAGGATGAGRRRGFAASEPPNPLLALRPAGLREWFDSTQQLQSFPHQAQPSTANRRSRIRATSSRPFATPLINRGASVKSPASTAALTLL